MMNQNQWAEQAQGLKLAIIGMDVHAATCGGLDAFERAVQAGKDLLVSLPADSFGRSGLSVWMEQAVSGALKDAWGPAVEQPEAVGVIVAPDAAVSAGQAGLIARRWKLEGPQQNLPVGDLAAAQGLQAAQSMLESRTVAAVLLAVELNAGRGASAVLLRRLEDAQALGERVYAVVAGAATAGQGWTGPDLAECARQSLEQAGKGARAPGLLEVVGLPGGAAWTAGTGWLERGYPDCSGEPACAVGIGDDGLLPALIKAALCLHHRQMPPAPEDLGSMTYPLAAEAPFYRAEGTRPWFAPVDEPRLAAVFAASAAGCAHIVLAETPGVRPALFALDATEEMYLVPVVGDSLEAVLNGMETLRCDLDEIGLPGAAQRAYAVYARLGSAAYALALVGRNAEELQRELGFAHKGVPAAFDKHSDWQTPAGSSFSPDPMGREGHVAFVYPGAFNSYTGMGRNLFRLFPGLHERITAVTDHPGGVFREREIYPRTRAPQSEAELAAHEAALVADSVSMLISGSSLSVAYTTILREVFGIQPKAAFGYSLGENSMMFSMGVWTDGDGASARVAQSPLFRSRLAGPQNAVRENWGLPALPEGNVSEPLWENHFLMAPVEEVRRVLAHEERVYLTHINTPRQVVIGGERDGCRRVIAALGCTSLQAPFDQALHNPAMRSEEPYLVEQHNWPVVARPEATLYSAAEYSPLALLDQGEVAGNIGRMLCQSLDFPRLVEQVYRDGARLFIEVGAGSNCARWVDETLKGSPHLAVAIDRKGVDDLTAVVRLLAKLVAHRTPLNLSPLFGEQKQVPAMAARDDYGWNS